MERCDYRCIKNIHLYQSWKPQEEKCEVCKPFSDHITHQREVFFWFVFNLEHLIIPLFFSKGYSLPCCIQQFHLFQIQITRLSWKPDTVEGGEGKNSIDVNEQTPHLRDFCQEEEIASLIVLGSCLLSPEGFVNHVNSGADEGMRAPFRQAAVRAPLIIWSEPDCRGAGGRYIRRVWGQDPFRLTGLLRLQHTCGLKIDSPLLCISSLADFIQFFFIDLSSWLS